ncbi:MAG TPA: response regulator [Steroidobacteraceae bacterium]|nr:response regulator [Steroidobacteraceae bacterium]HNS28148.1 response regulator [Steroidobacteraceae bacterium]
MVTKRALIVDDSKSARAFLSRILTRYEIEVDTAESAEQAIEYLGGQRPDVIFMDHLMPGMDGFQAVQVIKNNPRTATIPIMMYTSQEGELYVGQARALGAIGVLPKQIQPTDVSKVLYQLKLIPDRRSDEQGGFEPVLPGQQAAGSASRPAAPPVAVNGAGAAPATAAVGTSANVGAAHAAPVGDALPVGAAQLRSMVEEIVNEHAGAIRRSVNAHIDEQAVRLTQEVRAVVQEALPPAPAADEPRRRSLQWGWVAAAAALTAAAVLGAFWWREAESARALAGQLTVSREHVASLETQVAVFEAAEAARADEIASGVLASGTLADAGLLARALVPYGEIPLSNDRLAVVRNALERLTAGNFHGVVEVTTYPGRFCLIGNATEGYSLAPDETPVARCDLIGNPALEGTRPVQRESLAFANLVAESRRESGGAIDVRVATGEATDTALHYPEVTASLTAGEWNRAAYANNRVELRARSAP